MVLTKADFMTVEEYNRDFLPRVQRAREFVSLFESAINHMDDARVDKEEVRKQFRIRSWSEETKQTILIALAHYKKYEGLDKIESMEIIHCPTCGHHINIQSNGTAGHCPICDMDAIQKEIERAIPQAVLDVLGKASTAKSQGQGVML